MEVKNKIADFIEKHKNTCTIFGLFIIFYFIFFHNIGNYALMDADETRYVSMARDMFKTKDFMTLYLNGEYFFEKPPLYFWLECLSFTLFGHVNEFTARFPVSLLGMLTSFFVYFTGKTIVSRKFGILASLILATSLEFVMLAKFAILDIVLAACIGFSLCCLFITYFCCEKNKKYFWWLFYLFSGLAVMAKGIPGFVVPFGTMFLVSIYTKKFKQIFKPVYFIVGVGIFLLTVLPWHILMLKIHNPLFFNEYIIKHHIERFFTSGDGINRKQPLYFYFLTFLWGFIPWIFSLISVLLNKFFHFKNIKFYEYKVLTNEQKLVALNIISFIVIILFFSVSSTKLITYILPVYIPAAFICAYIWNNHSHFKFSIKLSTTVFSSILITISLCAMLTSLYLPEWLYLYIIPLKWFTVIVTLPLGITGLIFAKRGYCLRCFSILVIFITLFSAFATKEFYNIDYKFGQNDLMDFAHYAKVKNYDISTYDLSRKYSILYYRGERINFIEKKQSVDVLKNPNTRLIIKTSLIPKILAGQQFVVEKQGKRYSMIRGE